MARMAVLLAAACLFVGCARTSLTISHDGEIAATARTVDADKAADIVKEITQSLREICKEPMTLTLNPAIDEKRGNATLIKELSSLGSLGLKDIEKALGLFKKYLVFHVVTIKGKCAASPG